MKVSISCITYNQEKYIGDAIQSFLAQQTDFEYCIEIHNDASSDNTKFEIEKYRIIAPEKIYAFHHVKNKGIARNFFEAMQQCRGKYIALCEGDDYWTDPLKLQKQVDFLESHPEYSASCHKTNVVKDENTIRTMGDHKKNIFTAEDTLSKLSLFHTSSFVFRKNALNLPEWLTHIHSTDMALFSIISKSGPIYRFDEIMSHYRLHDSGITKTKNFEKLYHLKRIQLIKHLDQYHGYQYHEKAEQVIQYHKQRIRDFGRFKFLLLRLKLGLSGLIKRP
jgi:glycosyltransferase involved in cell wall biosynthesis